MSKLELPISQEEFIKGSHDNNLPTKKKTVKISFVMTEDDMQLFNELVEKSVKKFGLLDKGKTGTLKMCILALFRASDEEFRKIYDIVPKRINSSR